MPRIGVLWHPGSAEEEAIYLDALRQGFGNLGYVEGKNIVLENRFANEEFDQFFSLAADLVALKVDVFVAVTRAAAIAAKRSTSTIPRVFVAVPDPVGSEIVESLARPGANITGLSNMAVNLSAKRVELLKEALGDMSRAALLGNSSDPKGVRFYVDESLAAAKTLGIALKVVPARNPAEIDFAFSDMGRRSSPRSNGYG
jgi:putative tryptophan/tyrosine transport system substrate-binding protein